MAERFTVRSVIQEMQRGFLNPNTESSTEYTMYNDSNSGRKPLPFAMAEKIDNAVSATMVNSFLTLVTGPRRALSLKLSDTRVHAP